MKWTFLTNGALCVNNVYIVYCKCASYCLPLKICYEFEAYILMLKGLGVEFLRKGGSVTNNPFHLSYILIHLHLFIQGPTLTLAFSSID